MKLARPTLLALSLTVGAGLGASTAEAAPPSRACKLVKAGPHLVPDGASVVFHVDGSRATSSRLYKDLRGAMDRDLEVREALKVLDSCDLKPEDLHALTVGAGSGDNMVAVIQGRGIGKQKTLNCMRDQLAAREGGRKPWTVRRDGCYRVLASDGKDFGFVLDDSTVVISSEQWASQVEQLIRGKSTPAIKGNLATTVGRIDRTKTVWFAAAFDDNARSQMQGSAASGLRQVGGSMDFDRGLDLAARMGMVDPGAAKQFRDELTSYRDMAKAMGVVPSNVLDQIKIGATNSDVDLSMSLSFSDLEKVRKALEPHTQGKNPI